MVGKASSDAKAGDWVEVLDKDGERFGWGLYNPRSKMPLRIVSHSSEEINEYHFFETAIRRAASLRQQIHQIHHQTNSYRVIHGDADFMPGIVADKFGDVLSIEITSLAAWQRLPKWLSLMHECFDTRKTFISIDSQLARIEGIPSKGGACSDSIRKTKILENNICYEIDFSRGHKTGFFCDQRDNRRRFGKLAKGLRVLDLCCYSGGFSISAALAGAMEVTAVDLDENAITMAKRNANLNDARIKFTHADSFTWLRTMIDNGRKWDLVIADPPKFIHSKEDPTGQGKYADLNKLALQVIEPGGLFVSCSCSGLLGVDSFERIVTTSAHKLQHRLQIFDRTGQGADHPTLSNYPESRYLKLLWSRLIA